MSLSPRLLTVNEFCNSYGVCRTKFYDLKNNNEIAVKKIGKKTTKKTTAKKSPKRKVTCGRCGRIGHIRTKCHLKTTVDGVKITTKSWKYRPKKTTKSDSKKKLRVVCARCFRIGHESRSCRARTKLNPNSMLVKMEIRGLPIR